MITIDIEPEDTFGKEYTEHLIFEQLQRYSKFYDSLSYSIMCWITEGTLAITNLDTHVLSSMKGTIESINDTLRKGRINDSYALLRKYYDSTIINTYTNLYLSDNFSKDNFVVAKIDNWIKGIEKIPQYRIMSKYIKDSSKLAPINKLLERDDRYKKIRDRCNDNTHYNFYHHLLLNDNEIYNSNRVKYLNVFAKDIEAIFIQHFAYVFYLNDHYMLSSDYLDYIEMDMKPLKDSEFWVANFIQEIFDEIIKSKRYDIAAEIKKNTQMYLEL